MSLVNQTGIPIDFYSTPAFQATAHTSSLIPLAMF